MFCDPVIPTSRKVLVASVLGVGVFLIPNTVQSSTSNSATLQWAANQESDLAGYRVYRGIQSGSYGESRNIGNTTMYQFANLEYGQTHYFAVTAYDSSGNESAPSPEVIKTIGPSPDSDPIPNPDQNPLNPDPIPDPSPNPDQNPTPNPEFPILVNFQPPSSDVPENFSKDDGDVFSSSRGYGWDILVNGKERDANVAQTVDTFVQVSNRNPVTWNCSLPDGTYYVSLVGGDPKRRRGPHWLSIEGMSVAENIKTNKGQYLTVIEYPVEVQDGKLSITLGNGGKGATLLNFAIINSKPDYLQTVQVLQQNLGTDLVETVASAGMVGKINPRHLINQEKSRLGILANIHQLLNRIDRKLVKYADKPKVVARLNRKKEKLLINQEKSRLGILANIHQLLNRIDRKLVKYADKPKVVARLNRKKERLLARLDTVQKFQSVN